MMFAGMIMVENSSKTPQTDTDSACHRCAVRTGGASPTAAAGSHRRRPGYMCSEPLNQSCDKTPVSGSPTTENTRKSASKLPSEQWLKDVYERDDSQDSSKTHCSRDVEENSSVPSANVFNSSFSFIQQSLETSDLLDASTNKPVFKPSEWDRVKSETSNETCDALKPHTALGNHLSQSEISTVPTSQSEHEVFSLSNSPCSIGQSVQQKGLLLDRELWLVDLDVPWQRGRQISSSMASYVKESVQDSDSGSLDTESLLCLCLAERFGKKLEELRRERAMLKPGLPSRHPELTGFLERLRTAVHSVIHRTDTHCSQRLGSSLRRKVSESETQLLTLHEAKLVAISGNDFSSAKELKTEIRNAYGERDRLEGLKRKLKTLSTGSGWDLSRMKEQHNQIKLELQEREAQYERSLKENTLKYIELLEDRLHSCGSPVLEHIWEADLEACHLLLKGLDQRTSSISETEDLPSVPGSASDVLLFSKEEADCAMLTALGGRWCPEADLQHSEFTKKLEEFLFCLEDASPEDLCGETTELTERCELISERLHYLEDQLQTAIDHHDKDLTHILTELSEVKAALQAMLSQLKEEEDGEKYCDVEEEQVEDEELEEEHYFSDSWEI
uniref:DISC1 scaffold protein n=1 Tax=Cyprinus carpio TaxID=7962 RepID=A0A8C1PCH1_CYPCA